MAEGFPFPGTPPETVGYPGNPLPLVFEGFDGLNTKPSRPAIEDQELYICDGFMPIGKSNLRTLPGMGTALYTAPTGLTLVLPWFGNIGATAIAVVFLSDGSVQSVNVDTGVVTQIAAPGTIQHPSPAGIGISQWGREYILFSAKQTNGYFIWDGTLLYTAGTIGPTVTISSDGLDYIAPPDITAVGGSGSGATFTATLENGSLQSISVINPGHGYSYTDYVYLAFLGGGGNTSAIATAFISSGTVSSISVVNAGTGYTSTTSVALYGGGGAGAKATATVSSGTVSSISVTAAGEGYMSVPTVIITDANNPVAQATVPLMPFGVSGTAIETYQSHSWLADGSKILFTATESPSDFATSDGGGEFTSYDSFLKVGFSGLKQSNGFLYLVADSSLNYISGVKTSGSPATTTFSNQNVDPQIGSSWPGSLQVFSRNVVIANSFGIHVSYGGAVTKVSGALDGIYPDTELVGNFSPSSAVCIIYGIHVYVLLIPMLDQVTGRVMNKLVMWDGKKFWTANQELQLTWVTTQIINSQMTAWGTDGRGLYPLFQTPSTSLVKTAQSKLWAKPAYFYDKVTSRVFGLINYTQPSSSGITVTVDDGVDGTSTAAAQEPNKLTWKNASGGTITWTNASGGTLTWYAPGLNLFAFASSQTGALLGITLSTRAPDITILSTALMTQEYQTRF